MVRSASAGAAGSAAGVPAGPGAFHPPKLDSSSGSAFCAGATSRLSKRLLREAQHARYADVHELSAAYQSLAHETADHAEAVDAFSRSGRQPSPEPEQL